MSDLRLDFFASMTVCPSDVRKIRHHAKLAEVPVSPLNNILITPLFANPDSLNMIKESADKGSKILFDSGGYYVQIGRINFEELYLPLLETYRSNLWADIYTLPDHVPTSQDEPDVVEQKVRDTITFSTIFFQELPDNLKPKAMPVVQGHTLKQVEACLEAYINIGVKYIGFGSFGTMGKNSEVNIATKSAVDLACHVVEVAHSHGIKVHLFGLGAPALVAMIRGIGADSFDSSSWLKAAGFGQVFLPFLRAYNISHNSTKSELQKGITFSRFNDLRQLTQHQCNLCNSIYDLQERKMYRAVHNLITLVETVEMINQEAYEIIAKIYANGSPRYRGEFEKWLQHN